MNGQHAHSAHRISKATHKDVKEGSFKAVVDDLLLQVLLDACLGLEEREMGRTKSPGLPFVLPERAGGTWRRGCTLLASFASRSREALPQFLGKQHGGSRGQCF